MKAVLAALIFVGVVLPGMVRSALVFRHYTGFAERASPHPPAFAGSFGPFAPADPPVPAPAVTFYDGSGGRHDLGQFKGKLILVNFWATWCGPCVEEMPRLSALKATHGGSDFTVVAIAEDQSGAKAVIPFLNKQGLSNLDPYLDPSGDALRAFGIQALPTSLLIDGRGRILGRLEGGGNWAGPEAAALIDWYLKNG